MTHLLHDRDRMERELRDDLTFEERVQQPEDDEEDEGHDGAGFELEEGQISARLLEARLDAVHLLGLRFLDGELGGRVLGLHRLELLGGFVD